MATNESSRLRDIIKFNSHTQGRDKVYRTVQYASRFVIWYLAKSKGSEDFLLLLKKLEEAVGTSRKLFRIGTSAEFFQKAIDCLGQSDDYERVFTFIGFIGRAGWLIFDHGLWLGKIDLIRLNMAHLMYLANWCWLIGNLGLTLRDLRKLQLLKVRARKMRNLEDDNKEGKLLLKKEAKSIQTEFVKDALDMLIPLSGLGYVNAGLGAFAGLITSLIGFNQDWEKFIIET